MLRNGYLFNRKNTLNSLEGSGTLINGNFVINHKVTNYACLPLHVAVLVEVGSIYVQVS